MTVIVIAEQRGNIIKFTAPLFARTIQKICYLPRDLIVSVLLELKPSIKIIVGVCGIASIVGISKS